MRRVAIHIGAVAGLALLCAALFAGCGRASDDRREARDRHLRRAQAAKEAQDVDRAIELCERALRRRPDLALAHRELGLMLHNYRQDYVAAIYHYQRYLSLRPDAEGREDIEQLIRHCRISYAALIAESPEEVRKDLRARDRRIQELERELSALRNPGAAPEAAAKPAGKAKGAKAAASDPAPGGAAPARVHVVQAGENLATISMRYYGTRAKWKAIFDANRDRLADANNLRVGTSIAIPAE